MKKSVKVAAYVVGAILILLVLVMAVVPPVAKNYVLNNSDSLIGRKVEVGHIGLNLFTTTLTIKNLTIKEADEQTDFLKLEKLKVRVRLRQLMSNTLDIRKIHVNHLSVAVVSDSAGFNFNDIINRFAADTTAQADSLADAEGSKMNIKIRDIRLKNSCVSYADSLVGSGFNLKDINIAVPSLSLGGGTTSGSIDLNFDEGGHLSVKLNMDMDSSDFNVDVALNQFNIAPTLPYLLSVIRAGSLDGMLTTQLHVAGNLNNVKQTNVVGTVDVTNFALCDTSMNSVVTIGRSLVDVAEVNADSLHFHINKVLLRDAVTNAALEPNKSLNLLNMLVLVDKKHHRDSDAVKPKHDTLPHRNPSIIVDTVDLAGLTVNFADNTLSKPFNYSISDMSVQTQNFTLDSESETVVSGKMGETGQLDCSVKLNISKLPDINISVRSTNISLPEFSPYTSSLMAHNITKGNMSLVSQVIIDNKHLTGINNAEIVKCEVDKDPMVKNPVVRVPLKTALYVIKDTKDHIDIDLPVSGNIDSPSFSYWRTIGKTFTNMMIKVAATPLSTVGNAVGISGKTDYSQITFDAVMPDLSTEQYQTLNEIADMLAAKPELRLRMVQKINLAKAEKRQAMFDLKQDYYISQHAGKNAENLEIVDFEAIRGISDTDSQLADYVHGIDSTASVSDYVRRYADKARQKVLAKAAARQKKVEAYLLERKKLPLGRFQVSLLPDTQLAGYEGKDGFFVTVDMK